MLILLSIGRLNDLLLDPLSSELVVCQVLNLSDLISNQYSIDLEALGLCLNTDYVGDLLLDPCLRAQLLFASFSRDQCLETILSDCLAQLVDHYDAVMLLVHHEPLQVLMRVGVDQCGLCEGTLGGCRGWCEDEEGGPVGEQGMLRLKF